MKRREFMRNAAIVGATAKLPRVARREGQGQKLVDRKPLQPDPERLSATAKKVMVSTSHALATEAAIAALKNGGNAVDAYLTAALVQTVVEPVMTTLAGGLGLMFYEAKSGKLFQLGGGFAKPKKESDPFTAYDSTTGRSVMVPGYVAGVYAASKQKGKLSWRELFEPALYWAKNGFVIDHFLWGWTYEYRKWLGRFPEGREIWYPKGHLLGVGDILKQPQLATTIQRLIDEGPNYFYKGAWAKKFVQMVQAQGGRITLEDLSQFEVKGEDNWIKDEGQVPGTFKAKGIFREYEIEASFNAMMVFALNLVEQADLRNIGHPTESADALYHLIRIVQEAWHTGFMYNLKTQKTLLSKDYAAQVWKAIKNSPPRPYKGISAGTCAIVVVDEEGNVARGTHSSSSSPYGTGIIVDGVIANRVIFHRMTKFPAGLTTHLMVHKEGKPYFVLGSPSRSFFNNVFLNTVNVLEYRMNLWESVNQPMFGAPGPKYPGEEIETSYPEKVLKGVEKKGMQILRVAPREIHMGSCQAALIDRVKGVIHGVADPRRLGMAKGY